MYEADGGLIPVFQRWHSSSFTMGPKREVFVGPQTTLGELALKLAPLFGISNPKDVLVAKTYVRSCCFSQFASM